MYFACPNLLFVNTYMQLISDEHTRKPLIHHSFNEHFPCEKYTLQELGCCTISRWFLFVLWICAVAYPLPFQPSFNHVFSTFFQLYLLSQELFIFLFLLSIQCSMLSIPMAVEKHCPKLPDNLCNFLLIHNNDFCLKPKPPMLPLCRTWKKHSLLLAMINNIVMIELTCLFLLKPLQCL